MTLNRIALLTALTASPAMALDPLPPGHFDGMSRAEYLAEMETVTEAVTVQMALIYERLKPGLSDKVPGQVWNDEDRAVAACVYDKAVAEGKLEEMSTYLSLAVISGNKVEQNPDITFTNIDQYAEELGGGDQASTFLGYQNECGGFELQTRRMKELGTWQALEEVLGG